MMVTASMVEIYKVIAYIPLFNQIFDDKNKNGSAKGANNNQVYMRGNLNLLAIVNVFLMIRKMYNCDIPLRSHFVSDDNNPSRYAITCIFQPWLPHSYLLFRSARILLITKLLEKPL